MENNNFPQRQVMDNEIDLLELWNVLWEGKWQIIAITFIFAAGSVVYALSLPDLYKTEVLLAPVSDDSAGGGGLSSALGQLGGLAGLAGINLQGSNTEVTMKARALAIVQSRFFIKEFFEKHDALVPFLGTKPGVASGTIEIDPKLYDTESQQWVRKPSPAGNVIPSDEEVYESFSEILTVTEDETNGLVTIGLEWYEPRLIKEWMDALVKDLNIYMREQDTIEAQRAINYLNEQLQKTSLIEMRSVFFNLIEQQTQQVMLADSREEYALDTIDPAVVPETKSAPRRALICILGALLGAMLSIFIALLKHYAFNGNKELV